jgi:Tfp pilus assembly protein PilE
LQLQELLAEISERVREKRSTYSRETNNNPERESKGKSKKDYSQRNVSVQMKYGSTMETAYQQRIPQANSRRVKNCQELILSNQYETAVSIGTNWIRTLVKLVLEEKCCRKVLCHLRIASYHIAT